MKNIMTFWHIFIWYFARLFVTFPSEKSLTLENTKKSDFFWYFARRNFVGRITINDKIHHDEKNDFVGRSGVRHDYREGSEQ